MSPATPPPLLGTYTPPPVNVGDVVRCRYRRARCRVTSWTDAPIPWPRCNQLGIRGGSGLWVNDDLVRAIRAESAEALMYHFGVGSKAVWNWRRAFVPGEGKVRTAGDRNVQQRRSEAGNAALRGKEWTDEERDARAKRAKRLGLRPPNRWATTGWTADQDALLGTMPDADVATLVGRTPGAVRSRRTGKQIPTFQDRRRVALLLPSPSPARPGQVERG